MAEALFYIDKSASGSFTCDKPGVEDTPAWHDEDDLAQVVVDLDRASRKKLRINPNETAISGQELEKRLRSTFASKAPRPSWAKASDFSETSNVFRLKSAHRGRLLPDTIGLQRMPDGNVGDRKKERVVSADLHPSSPLLVVSGENDSCIRVFHINDRENPKMLDFEAPGLTGPIARFSPCGRAIVLFGRGSTIYTYDIFGDGLQKVTTRIRNLDWSSAQFSPSTGLLVLLSRKTGRVALLSLASNRLVSDRFTNVPVSCMATSLDGRILLTAGTDKCLYVWDLELKTCLQKITLETGTGVSSLALSGDSTYLAVGSRNGLVDIYIFPDLMQSSGRPSPWKTLENLTCCIDIISFHPSGELFAYGSRGLWNGLRLVHLPTGRVYSNWPQSARLGKVQTVSFDHTGSVMAVGTGEGKVKMFALRDFK